MCELVLLLTETFGFFDGICKLLYELIVRFVGWKIQPVEAGMRPRDKFQKKKVLKSRKDNIYLGSQDSFPTFSMQNLCGPLEPISSANPPTGTRQVPHTN
jgi:hypothetical protein